jgi:hypothetical protein
MFINTGAYSLFTRTGLIAVGESRSRERDAIGLSISPSCSWGCGPVGLRLYGTRSEAAVVVRRYLH